MMRGHRLAAGAACIAASMVASCAWHRAGVNPPAAASPSAPALLRHVFTAISFGGMSVELCLYAPDAAMAEAAAAAAFARIAELSAMMSDYELDPPSPLNRIAAAAPAAVVVPPELLAVLGRAIELHRITAGAFDVTAKPFVQLWRVSQRLGELPPAASLRRAKRFVDIGALELDAVASTARLRREGMWLDLGGIAKGMIGDEVVGLLRRHGTPRCRYTAGGDMVFGEPPPGESGWNVTVPDFPVAGADGAAPGCLTFSIANAAASVSGDVFRFVEIDGAHHAH
ncbi:MAG: FAD:protein FMN transferase, partial [Planctomycetes bacterium]|nr:FAD:protein FMN transferase [Planctomycetota bacterium]